MKTGNKKILIFADFYLPGHKAGGPIKTLSNLVQNLGKTFQFHLVTRDRDDGDQSAYSQIKVGQWQQQGLAQVFYLAPEQQTFKNLLNIIHEINPDLIYLNSFFSYRFSIKVILLNKLNLFKKVPLIVAPRGEFADGALGLKSFKKKCYLLFSKIFSLYKKVTWHTVSQHEKEDLQKIWGKNLKIKEAPNLGAQIESLTFDSFQFKGTDKKLRLMFLGRVAKVKNLHVCFDVLKEVKSTVIFNIYGPIPEEDYWKECQEQIRNLPSHIEVHYCGCVGPSEVSTALKNHDLFFLPTSGENFGHAILESLQVGTPVLISNTTPWRNLSEKGAGWDLSLNDLKGFRDVIESVSQMSEDNYLKLRQSTYEMALSVSNQEKTIEQSVDLLMT